MSKEIRKNIKQLKKQKRYEDIFVNYGQKEFKRNVPYSYRKRDLKKLKREGKYEDIFNKYGENEYNKLLLHARTQEIKEAQGKTKAYTWNALQKIKMIMKKMGIYSATGIATIALGLSGTVQSTIDQNTVKYEKEIEEYDQNISEYAKKVKEMNLNDLQTIMKVTDDMWKNIQGYASPEKNIMGYMELDLATKDGYGVCRNMASDVAKKLNKINEKYNARTMNVTIKNGEYNLADIERNVIETNETVDTTNDYEQSKLDKILQSTIGNHMITLIDIPGKDVTLVVDPTNPSLGFYKNGKIKMFNSGKEYGTNEISTMIYSGNEGINVVGDFIDSFTNDMTYKELEEEYGLNKQNEALEYVRKLEKDSKKSKQEKYVETLRVEKNQKTNNKRESYSLEENKDKDSEELQL